MRPLTLALMSVLITPLLGAVTIPSGGGKNQEWVAQPIQSWSPAAATRDTTNTMRQSVRTANANMPITRVSASRSQQRRGLWIATGGTPTVSQVDQAAQLYGVVVLNAWETWALRRIKQNDPSVVVLMYKCLSSTRRYADRYAQAKPTGVGYNEAETTDTNWFAKDSTGARIVWGPYPDHWQMAVWNRNYQQRWTQNVTREVVAGGWDGVLADNDFAHLKFYSPAILAGTTSASATDARIRTGLDDLVTTAGTNLKAAGKIFVPNLSEARLFPGRWALHSRFGGAMEENFLHFGTDPNSGFVHDWRDTGWQAQAEQMSTEGLSLAVTRAQTGDHRTLLYGYTTTLLMGDPTSYWSPSTPQAEGYSAPESIPEMSWPTGRATTNPTRLTNGAWTRTFEKAFTAVNPTTNWVTIHVPPTHVNSTGTIVTQINLRPTSAAILRR